MIKNWSKFFESNQEELTEEMVQEILYTFGEDSKGYNNDDPELKDFLSSEDIWDDIVFYETDYDEMKEFTKTLLKNAQNNEWIKSECIKVYKYIRKKNDIFPHIYEIEDLYLSLIEKYDFGFYVSIDMGSEYEIKLSNWSKNQTLQDFIMTCQEVEKSIKRIESPKHTTKLTECKYHERWVEFRIKLRSKLVLEEED